MITILCGKVAAGKTALARRMAARGAVVLSCDEMMLGLFDGCLGREHDATALKCLTYLFSVAAQLEVRGVDSVVDYGFWLRAEREAARTYFSALGLPWRLLLVEVPEPLRLARLARRNEGLRRSTSRVYLIEGELLERMDSKFQPPAPAENAVIFDNTKDVVDYES